MNWPRKYADILPTPSVLGESSSASSSQPPSENRSRKRSGPSVACEECRTRKTRVSACQMCPRRLRYLVIFSSFSVPLLTRQLIVLKCDGARPACSNCAKRGKPSCLYLDKQKTGPTAMQWLDRLKTWPRYRALMLLNSLRARDDLVTLLSEFSDPEQAIEALGTPSSLFEAELIATNPNSYPALRPIDISVFTESHLLHPTRASSGSGKR